MGTVTIPLTKGKTALIDEEDLPLVSQHSWSACRGRTTWYAATKIKGTRGLSLSLHQLLLPVPPDQEVDHINRNGLDCRRANLRAATRTQNAGNTGKRSHNTSGWKGVCWDEPRNAWIAIITHAHKTYHLGRFADPIDAARAYDAKARELYGEFAGVNFPHETLPPRVAPNTQPRKPRRNRTGFRGVTATISGRKGDVLWRATIKDGPMTRYIGWFATAEQAARAYDAAARAAFGTLAVVNFPD